MRRLLAGVRPLVRVCSVLLALMVCLLLCLFGAAAAFAAGGTISTFAGNGTVGYSGDGGAATSAELRNPTGVAVDASGDTLIADASNNVVRLVAAADCSSGCPYGLSSMTQGDIYTVAGDGTHGYSGDGGPATSAELHGPDLVAVDPDGNLLIADGANDVVRLVAAGDCSSGCPYGLSSTTQGDIYTVVGDGTAGYSGDGGPATSAELNQPDGMNVDSSGDLLIADLGNNRVRLVAAADCSSGCPYGLSSMTKGDIYTVAGDGTGGHSGDGGAATSAELNEPDGVGVDLNGDLLIGDEQNQRVRLVAAASCSSSCPYGLASMTTGDIYTVAGDGTFGNSGEGVAATSGELGDPAGVGVDPVGDLLIANVETSVVRLVAGVSCSSDCPYGLSSMTEGDIYTVAGDGSFGDTGDGGPATSAELAYPFDVAFQPDGNLLIAEQQGNRVRSVTLASGGAASPSLSATAPSNGTVGSAISASSVSSTLSGGTSPTGTISFKVFGPESSPPTDCASGATTVGAATVTGNGTYDSSASFTPASAGDYWWYASYGGDADNNATASTCGASMAETVVSAIGAASPSVSGTPNTTSVTLGSSPMTLSDTATLSGGASTPSGTITFTLYQGATLVDTETATVSGNGSYSTPGGYTLPSSGTVTGTYQWDVSYSGDSNNNAASDNNDPGEQVTVSAASPSVSSGAPSSATAGTAIPASSISSVLSGGYSPTGSVSFEVFGPQSSAPTNCSSGGTTVGTATVSGNGTYDSNASFTPASAGDYWWYASYGGDSNNNPAAATCGASMAETVVAAAPPAGMSLSTTPPSSQSGFMVDPGIELSCPSGGSSCSTTEQATAMIGAQNTPVGSHSSHIEHAMTVGGADSAIPAGSSSEVTFQLNQLGQTLLLDHKHLQVTVTVTGQQQGASPVTATKTITLNGRFATYKVSAIKVHPNGRVSLKVKVSAPGQVNVLITAWKSNMAGVARVLNPADGRFVVGRASANAKVPKVLTFNVRPNAAGRQLIAHPAYPVTVRLWVSYIPLYAFQRDTGYYRLRPSR
ncbi:MAG TPA: hypothetical protein VMA77_04420 [Solirubrobacteraceae bacterium]|nr:hypothetical protein [Solirubrobacteraceae bacterium]